MLKFVPVACDKLGEPFSSDDTVCGYLGYDLNADGKLCGRCAFRLFGYKMEVIYVEVFDKDAETAEGLIRSALNYGANRMAYIAYYKAESYVSVAELLGFEKDKSGVLSGDIPTLLKGSCCKGN